MNGYEDISPIANWVLLFWSLGVFVWFVYIHLADWFGWWLP